jgi:hypothetical protein
MLIRAYGEFWNPDLVEWGRRGGEKGKLEGRFGPARNATPVDVWDQQGIYVLQHEWKVVYVGMTGKTALGSRIRAHLSDGLAGRWDSFSWYGVRGVSKRGLTKLAKNKNVFTKDVIESFEALVIAVTEPPMNARREAIPGATLVIQEGGEPPRPMRGILEDLRRDIRDLSDRLHRIEAGLTCSPPELTVQAASLF